MGIWNPVLDILASSRLRMDEISVVRGGRKHLALRVEIWQVLVACVMLLLGDVFFFCQKHDCIMFGYSLCNIHM